MRVVTLTHMYRAEYFSRFLFSLSRKMFSKLLIIRRYCENCDFHDAFNIFHIKKQVKGWACLPCFRICRFFSYFKVEYSFMFTYECKRLIIHQYYSKQVYQSIFKETVRCDIFYIN